MTSKRGSKNHYYHILPYEPPISPAKNKWQRKGIDYTKIKMGKNKGVKLRPMKHNRI